MGGVEGCTPLFVVASPAEGGLSELDGAVGLEGTASPGADLS